MVDTRALLERVDLAALIEGDLGQPACREGRWLKWTCPFHDDGKTPSLGVAGNRWKCFGCGRSGDAIDWLREREELSFREACKRLGSVKPVPTSGKEAQPTRSVSSPPPAAWQEQAQEVTSICQATLWSDVGARARAWLNQRGLARDTVRSWRLGFNADDQKLCGLWVPRGIVIPCLVSGRIWYLKVRRAAGPAKYSQVAGGQIALFGSDTITRHSTVVVTEGEFDAILLHQEAGDLVSVVTLGQRIGSIAGCLGALSARRTKTARGLRYRYRRYRGCRNVEGNIPPCTAACAPGRQGRDRLLLGGW